MVLVALQLREVQIASLLGMANTFHAELADTVAAELDAEEPGGSVKA
jgi:hypothetical protein